ncbi:MAG: hydrogenase expression protein HypE [Solirubrobacteraceae bacterium]|nr:MAG: hydrogenase expression protein HypE [Solirubrobacterales bacterium]
MLNSEFAPRQAHTERMLVSVVWMTSGLGCDGDSVALTAATNPSLEELLRGAIPGMPGVVLYNPMLAYETGADFMRTWYEAEAGRLNPFVLVLEGSVPNEQINGEGHWAGLGVDPDSGQPITTNEWIDRLAPKAAAVIAIGTCAAYGGIPAMRNNPTGAMGLRDYLGWDWTTSRGVPIVNLPGCPVQPDNITETLLYVSLQIAGMTPPIDLDDQGRPAWLFKRTVHEGCDRAGQGAHGKIAERFGDDNGCLIKLGCKGPVVKCNVPVRGWMNAMGGCPNVGGLCIGCTSPGFPDRFMPFMEPDRLGLLAARTARFSYGALTRYLRDRAMRNKYEVEPEWRRPSDELETGFQLQS